MPGPDDPPQITGGVTYPPGFELPGQTEIAERYRKRTGFDVSDITWYLAFARWKTATVYQQLANRALRGESSDTRSAELGNVVPMLARSAQQLLDGASLS